MKSKLFFILVLAGTLIVSSSCKEKTGSLRIKVLYNGTTPVQGAFVGVATSEENIQDSYYVDYQLSDASGESYFTELLPDDYFYQVYFENNGTQYNKVGPIMIPKGKVVDLTVSLP